MLLKEIFMKKLILASASPRRRELLKKAGYKFDVITSDVDENIDIAEAPLLVRELALLKASAVAKIAGGDCLVIGADTVVSIDGQVLGKPMNIYDAKRMLRLLSGRAHQVYTGVCVTDVKTGRSVCKSARTDVLFRRLSKRQIRSYIATKEPMDKAGAYAIQGGAAQFVRCISGSCDNVVGLPVGLLREILNTEFNFV